MFDSYIWQVHLLIYIYSDHVFFRYSCQNVNVAKGVVNFRFDYASDFCLGLSVGPPV